MRLREKPKIVLYRILGNDLPPRHKRGQTYTNLKFILEQEPLFINCQKKWIVNRAVDFREEEKILRLLEEYKQPFIRIPFSLQEYVFCSSRKIVDTTVDPQMRSEADCQRHNKILYIMNNNGARNVALRDGRQVADWILPFDGNCCFDTQGWQGVVNKLQVQQTTDKCFVVPMYRLKDNLEYFNFNPKGSIEFEPQVIFGKDSDIEFNESYRYGLHSKIDLLKRLNLKYACTDYGLRITDTEYKCGYVLRLFSGVHKGEGFFRKRVILRKKATDLMIRKLDRRVNRRVILNRLRSFLNRSYTTHL